MNRRRFLRNALAVSGASLLRLPAGRVALAAKAPKKLLILGGTSFLGPAIVEAALAPGHEVVLFNRGITHPELFPRLEKLRGYRSPTESDENWTAVGSRRWDAVIDVWPFDPSLSESAAKRLRDRVDHYLYVSSIAAYDPRGFARPGLTEEGALNAFDPAIRPYDRGKAESERRLPAIVGQRLTIVRPCGIKGDRDDSPDLLPWFRRAQRGGRHIGPGSGEDYVQKVDVKDVARFLVDAIERSVYGTFNLTGTPLTFRDYLARCNAAVHSDAEFVWIPREFLHAQGLDPAPWGDPRHPSYLGKFPSWHPEPEHAGFSRISSRKAFDTGWTQRPFEETLLDELWSYYAVDIDSTWTDELDPEVEARVLERWRAHATR